jgi:glutamate carboxypeptidase
MSRILDYLQTRQEAMTQTLKDLVVMDSPSHERMAVNAVADFLARSFGELGADVRRLPQAAFGDHIQVTWGRGERQLLLLGHMDTVWPLGETKERPFRRVRDRATGPGVFDMKGGVVIGLYAVASLCELEITPAHQLVFLFNSDEEVGSPTSREFI